MKMRVDMHIHFSTLNILLQTKETKKKYLWNKNESNAGTCTWEMHQQQFLRKSIYYSNNNAVGSAITIIIIIMHTDENKPKCYFI